ncbi:MAG: Plastocyanin [Parcubacteria group bacterium GW2011_GWF2_39_8b]|nr:MAG: Plastocyanin [Parcubacteria group bacterium GW2011_GWF2_39_8b]
MNKIITIVVLLIVIGAGIFLYNDRKTNQDSRTITTDIETVRLENIVPSSAMSPTVKEFTVVGTNFSYEPKIITVKKGDTVKIIFKDNEGFHDLKISGYDVITERINAGSESSVQFVADKTGNFEYFCTVGNHRAQGMKGTFVVTE